MKRSLLPRWRGRGSRRSCRVFGRWRCNPSPPFRRKPTEATQLRRRIPKRQNPKLVIPAKAGIHFDVAVAVAVVLGLDATSPEAHAPQPRRACAWMRTRAMGQDVPYGAAPRKVLDLVAFDLKQAFFFGYFLLSR
ncbi:hypothetical protein RDV84_07330 [Lysobacter yananisis]|uniref:Uncharacterized protein n=1 Tax=Lysobacter yananisis TaxID=1003114 RepID=A0ABY9PC53_9GAMM|nr:hypothetical protein [Lysobacter yananisis]WMT04638.1 hypothetical protein RDV84_07330 [Lysobacter yananisis]